MGSVVMPPGHQQGPAAVGVVRVHGVVARSLRTFAAVRLGHVVALCSLPGSR